MLDANTQSLWDEYLAQEREHVRSTYLATLDRVIVAFSQLPESDRESWAKDIARQVIDEKAEIPVRMPLFRQVVFPVLITGLTKNQPGCARWLAGFEMHLLHVSERQNYLPDNVATSVFLLRKALEVDADDSRARRGLISRIASHLEYSLHELPAGVLYGMNGASISECAELIQELDEFCGFVKADGREDDYRDLTEECRLHFSAYRDYLENRRLYASYASYLSEKHDIEF